MKRYSLILFLTICLEGVFGQQASYYFKHYNINSGLSQNTAMSLFQDSKGFIWIGTKNGLNRFDGNEFKIYQRKEGIGELRNSIIYCINEDRNNTLWIGTDKGISLYDPCYETFSNFDLQTDEQLSINNNVFTIFIDKQDRIWILTSDGLFLYKSAENKLFCLNDKFTSFTPSKPSALYVNDDGIAYVGFPKLGIIKYNIHTDQATFDYPNEHTPICISEYQSNYILLGTLNRGLYKFNKNTGKSEKIPLDETIDSNVFVRSIEKISDTEYWIGAESGVYILKNEEIVHIIHENFDPLSISDNAIYSICKDREGGIWIGSYFGGVDYIPVLPTHFRNFYPIAYKNSISGYRVREFVSDEQGNLWIATEDNGLNYYDVHNDTFTHTSDKSKPLSISFSNIQCLNLHNDQLWVGTFTKGIDVLNLKTKQCRHYEKTNKPHSFDNNDIFAIYTDSRNTTWIGSTTSLHIYDPQIDGFRPFDRIQRAFISDITEDANGYIWFATYNRGAIRYNHDTDEIKEFRYNEKDNKSICFDRINSIFQDSQQRLWFTSEDGGFCLYNEQDETFTRITTQDGLPSNVVYEIEEDNNHQLWLSTNNGLVHFNPQTMSVEALYNLSNGLHTKQFNYKSGIKGKDGTLYFGSINGFVAFNPATFRPIDNQYSVVLTDFYIFDKKIKVNKADNTLMKAMPYTDIINLKYDQSTFSFSFSALNYPTIGSGKYTYQLEGIDKKWAYTDDGTKISYNSIPPGTYTFQIKYSKDGHNWGTEITKVKIHIAPPLWQTPLAYALYTIAILTIFFFALRYYQTKKKKQDEEKVVLQEQEKKEEIYKAKIDFFTNIAHEIRTPITLIKAPLDYILRTQPAQEGLKENLHVMERNTDRLLVLVNQLLDFRKIESKAFALKLSLKNINVLVTNTYNRFVPTARQKGLTMSLECPSTSVMASVDEEAITKVCSNLFNNAIKYSSTYIKVVLSENKNSTYFQIDVSNDGDPIPVELRENIFEPFFRIRDDQQAQTPGSGIGLTLATSLVQLHNGKLYLDDKAEETLFTVQIPTNISAGIETEEVDLIPDKDEEFSSLISEGNISTKETALIVEDNEDLRKFLATQLGNYYQVITAGNGIEATEILNNEIINIVISDVMMPLMDGFELCKSIKSNLETCHIPIILLTAKATLKNKIEGLKYGADAYIEKPFDLSLLLVQINNLLENRSKLRQNFANSPYLATNTMAQNKADEAFLNKLTEVIMLNLSDDTFNIDNLASEMNMSRTSLHRKLKGISELTPGDFIRIVRLKKAAELLQKGEYRINEICMLIGFHSLSYFSKSFHKQFGVLPKDFVKKHSK